MAPPPSGGMKRRGTLAIICMPAVPGDSFLSNWIFWKVMP